MFISDLSRLENQRQCLSLQCGRDDPKFIYKPCEDYLIALCRYPMNPAQGKLLVGYFITPLYYAYINNLHVFELPAQKLQINKNIMGCNSSFSKIDRLNFSLIRLKFMYINLPGP